MLEVMLRHHFGGFTLDAAFQAAPEGVTALFGPSGCGKSTVLKAVAGLLRPDEGRIAFDGVPLLDTARRVMLPPERRRCGLVFQEARLFSHMSVASNLRYGLRRAPRDATGPGFDEVLALLGIEPLLDRRPARLSGGERQRVALGRALLMRPRLLLMDEPLAALDAARRAEILPFLARLREAARMPILYVTHALDEVDALADRLVLMEAGKVVAAGTVEELTARTDLPLAARRDAGVVIPCTVLDHDIARGLTRFRFPGGELVAPLRPEPAGTRLRLRLRARDVSVATAPPEGISMQNVLPATLAAIAPTASPHEVFLHLALGETTLLARVTRDALERLGLTPGARIWAMIKSVTFDQARGDQARGG
ncbi:molybdenum ABC transporter ATP-binding protein [Roseococcus sp.]|uniref:molybdenum ABC transporter ATP-binding protein n=1 Tax=Roseococcus sp. TaxID=2109646 RepID=UPI003BAADB52